MAPVSSMVYSMTELTALPSVLDLVVFLHCTIKFALRDSCTLLKNKSIGTLVSRLYAAMK